MQSWFSNLSTYSPEDDTSIQVPSRGSVSPRIADRVQIQEALNLIHGGDPAKIPTAPGQ